MKINDDKIIGLDNNPDSDFSPSGCDNCGTKLGQDVFLCKAHYQISKNRYGYYVVNLCQSCLSAYHYAENLEDDCQNKFNI